MNLPPKTYAVVYAVEFEARAIRGESVVTGVGRVPLRDVDLWRFDHADTEAKFRVFDLWRKARRKPQDVDFDWKEEGF